MTSFDKFLERKRQERKRGKLAGIDGVIQELMIRGASFREIAEYLREMHSISITPRGLAKHVQRRVAAQLARPPTAPHQSTTGATTEFHPRPSLTKELSEPGKVSKRCDAVERVPSGSTDDAPTPKSSRTEGMPDRYDRNSEDHLSKVAALRQHHRDLKQYSHDEKE